MRYLALIPAAWLLLTPVGGLYAQRGGMGGMGGGGFSQPRFSAPELPGPELEGPPDSASAQRILSMNPDQMRQYVQAYDSFMVATKAQRDSSRGQLAIAEEKLDVGDRAAALFYAERAEKLAKSLKERQVKFEDTTLAKILSAEQMKAYRKWKKEQDLADEDRKKEQNLKWTSYTGFDRMDRPAALEERVPVSAPVGGPPGTSPAVRIGRTVYVAGQVALDSAGNLVGEGDLKAQAVKAFANLGTVLQAARARPTDVVRLTIYVVNYRPENLALIREVGAAYLPERNPPGLTVLGVQSLYREGLLISVEAVATANAFGGGGAVRGGVRDRGREP